MEYEEAVEQKQKIPFLNYKLWAAVHKQLDRDLFYSSLYDRLFYTQNSIESQSDCTQVTASITYSKQTYARLLMTLVLFWNIFCWKISSVYVISFVV